MLFKRGTMQRLPAPDPLRTMAVSVWAGGLPILNATGLLQTGGGTVTAANVGGRLVFTLPADLQYGWTRTFYVEAPGFVGHSFDLTLSTSCDVTLSPIPSRVVLPKLSIVGKFFRAGGERWTGIGCSDFALYARYLNGEDTTPILAERRDLGFNFLRVWLLNTSVYRIVPSEWGDRFYTALPAFCDLCAKYSLYVQFTALTQTRPLMEDGAQQQGHINRVDYELRDQTNCFFEGGNEIRNSGPWGSNALWEGLSQPPYGIWAYGSNNGDPADNRIETVWAYSCIHSWSASGQLQRAVGKQAREESDITKKPAGTNENARFNDNESSEQKAYDAAAGSALLAAFSLYHSTRGKVSELMQECTGTAKAWCDGARSVPLQFQDGAYVHRTDLEKDDVLRVYGSRLPDGREYDVVIRK